MTPLESLPVGGAPAENQGLGFSFGDLTTIPEDKFPCLPAGRHTLVLEGGGLKTAESGNVGLGLRFACELQGTNYKVFYTIWRQKEGGKPLPRFVLQRHRDLLIALGLPLKLDFANEDQLNANIGAKVGVQVVVMTQVRKSDDYGDQPNISKVIGKAS
jgi:hypothetical protein